MNIFVYPAPDEAIENELKQRYVQEVLTLDGKDLTFKKQLKEGNIRITLTKNWKFFCRVSFNQLDVTISYIMAYFDKMGSAKEVQVKSAEIDGMVFYEDGSAPKFGHKDDNQKFKHVDNGETKLVSNVSTKKINLCSETDQFDLEIGSNPYTYLFDLESAAGMNASLRGKEKAQEILQACEKREKGTVPAYVDRSVAKRARNFDIKQNLAKKMDVIKERALEKCKNIRGFIKSSFELEKINNCDLASCDIYIYPLYDIEVAYEEKIYGVYDVSPLDEKLVTISENAAPDSSDYKKLDKAYNVTRKLVFTQIIATAAITAALFFLMIFGKIPFIEEYLGWILFVKVVPFDFIAYRAAGLHDWHSGNIQSIKRYLLRLRAFSIIYLIGSIVIIAFVLLKTYGLFF